MLEEQRENLKNRGLLRQGDREPVSVFRFIAAQRAEHSCAVVAPGVIGCSVRDAKEGRSRASSPRGSMFVRPRAGSSAVRLIVWMTGFRLGADVFRSRGRDTEQMARRQQAVDVAVAALVALGCSLEVWAPWGSTHMTGPRAAVFVAYMVAALALAVRRRLPLASTLVLVAALTSEWLAFGSPAGFGVFMTLVLAGYSVAANSSRGRALVGFAALAFAAAVWTLRDPTQTTVHERIGRNAVADAPVSAWSCSRECPFG